MNITSQFKNIAGLFLNICGILSNYNVDYSYYI